MKPEQTRLISAWCSVLSACVVTLVAGLAARADTVLFLDTFDAGSSAAQWTLFSAGGDYTADFAFDYSTRGIPSAPSSTGGTTIGLKFTVNKNDAIAAKDAVSAFLNTATFAGNQTLKFDMWLNYNGGAGGGSGSTEFAAAGINHAGTQVIWPDNTASDGLWFAVCGEGGESDDYRAYVNATLLSVTAGGYAGSSRNHTGVFYQTLFPSPTYETVGAPGKHWVQVTISRRNGVIEWRLNGMLITLYPNTSLTAGRIMLGYMDTYPGIANPPGDNFVIFDNVRVEAPDCNTNGVFDDVDLAGGTSLDCNGTGVPDECEPIGDGDFDVDGDLDLDDYAVLVDCLDGAGSLPVPADPDCIAACQAAFDFNDDTDVDLGDFLFFQSAYTTGLIPPRAAGAPSGTQFYAEVASLTRAARETRVTQEVLGGNLPGFLRTFVPVTVSATIGGTPTTATYYVTPDYLAIGRDDDFVRMPMSPVIAQPIADAFGCLLPTRKMVNDIWAAATVKLAPYPISPATVDIMLATTFYRHHQAVEAQRAGQPLGQLIAGIQKDVVITPLLATNPNKVAIYGWHYQNGTPIQPLYLGHESTYMDYSHGIRLVRQQMLVNGVEMSVASVLADPSLCVLLSDEGVVTNPHY